jgi:hypothetical protein
MNYLKMLGTAVLAMVAVTALAGSASATSLTSPQGTTYTSTFKAQSSHLQMHGSFTTVTCSSSAVEGKLETHGSSVTAGGKLSSLTFSGCNYSVTVLKAGSVQVHSGGTVTSSGAEVKAHTSVGECVFTTNATDVGTGTGTKTTGGNAVLDIPSVTIPRTGGSFFCGSSATATGSYTVTTPSTLFLD